MPRETMEIMRAPLIDARDADAIAREIAERSRVYTPAWRFDAENPDVGSVLALIFAQMFSETVDRFNGVLEHNFLHFLGALGGKLRPALPAQGYVQFSLAPLSPQGALVGRNEKLSAHGGEISFETLSDVLVTTAQLMDIYAVNPRRDLIVRLMDAAEPAPFRMFDFSQPNLQNRAFALSHGEALWVSRAAVELSFRVSSGDPASRAALEALCACAWSVHTPDGPIALPAPEAMEGGLRLDVKLDGPVPLCDYMESPGRWLIAQAGTAAQLNALAISEASIRVSGSARADAAFANDQEQNLSQFFPFGEQFSPYDDCLIQCDEALSKHGAQVEMAFHLGYERVRIDAMGPEQDIDWKLVMKRSDVKPEEEYDITIPSVAWEYWNGFGWARLFADERYDALFDASLGEEAREAELSFTVPSDIAPTAWGSRNGYFIRARVRRVRNQLRTRGWYVSPTVEDIRVRYGYQAPGVRPEMIACAGNMYGEAMPYAHWFDQGLPLRPFQAWPAGPPCAYLRFDRPPVGAPLRVLIDLSAGGSERVPPLRWEYLALSSGREQWLPLNCMDGTDSLRKTGVLTFVGDPDFAFQGMFGQEGYWIRVIGADEGYDAMPTELLPLIRGLHMNSVAVMQRNTLAEQVFLIDSELAGIRLALSEGNLLTCEVRIESLAVLSRGEIALMEDERKADVVRAPDGTISQVWVLWEPVEDILLSTPTERCYEFDPIAGTLLFGDGRHGRIPHAGAEVRVLCSVGGGARGNVAAGEIDGMDRQIGFIQSVGNPLAAYGGCEQETVEEAALRTVSNLRHRGRAVAAVDYENLALEASRAILRAECYCGRDERGLAAPGEVTLVILQRDYLAGRPFFDQVREQVASYIRSRAPGDLVATGKLHVVQPQFIALCCRIEAVVERFDDVYTVQQQMRERLREYLDPVTGNFGGHGWKVGELPNTTQIYNAVKSVANITRVRRVTMTAYVEDARGRREVDLERLERVPYCLPMDGEHDLRILVQ